MADLCREHGMSTASFYKSYPQLFVKSPRNHAGRDNGAVPRDTNQGNIQTSSSGHSGKPHEGGMTGEAGNFGGINGLVKVGHGPGLFEFAMDDFDDTCLAICQQPFAFFRR